MKPVYRCDIIYQDEHYVAINKPAGLLVHPTIIDRHERHTALSLLTEKLGFKPFMMHRLDKPTSGVLLLALTRTAAREGVDLFTRNRVKKTYVAVVRGFTEKNGKIDSPLKRVPDKMLDRRRQQTDKSKKALTLFERISTVELPVFINRYPSSRYSLLKLSPHSGRTHQLRRHLKKISHPIIGDSKYGDHTHNHYFRDELDCERLLLAATELVFPHPFSGEQITLIAPIDTGFEKIIERMGWVNHIRKEWKVIGKENRSVNHPTPITPQQGIST